MAAVGCRFTPGDFRGQDAAAIDGDSSSPDDVLGVDAPTDCYQRWFAGTIRFDTPIEVPNVNSAVYDRDPFLSPDELTLWLSSGRNGTDAAVYKAKRTNLTSTFSMPMIDTDFDSTDDESKLSITSNGLVAVVGSNRGSSQGIDVWETQRTTTGDNWPALSRSRTGNVNTNGADHDPTISADGLTLYLSPDTQSPQRLVSAKRTTVTGNFAAPVEITELNDASAGTADPSPSPDERIILFASGRTIAGGPLEGNLWYSTRASKNVAWNAPTAVPDVNMDLPEGDPHLSTDGCRIYFSRDLGSDNWNLFVASAVP
jgi:hypothetical protein